VKWPFFLPLFHSLYSWYNVIKSDLLSNKYLQVMQHDMEMDKQLVLSTLYSHLAIFVQKYNWRTLVTPSSTYISWRFLYWICVDVFNPLTLWLWHIYYISSHVDCYKYSFIPRTISDWKKRSQDVWSKPSFRCALIKLLGPVENNFWAMALQQ